ncbi:MAG: coiled-coil domain-containing protein, partial [Planctomycetota bacterium]
MREVIGHLEQLRRRTRIALFAQSGAVLLACIITGLLVLIGLDFVFRLPSAARLTLDLLALGAVGYGVSRLVWPVVRYDPTLTQLALRVERTLPSVAGWLASSVEFAMAGAEESDHVAGRVVAETQARLLTCDLGKSLDMRRTWRDLGALAATLAIAVVFFLASPGSAATGLARVLMPYGDAAWPARTGVASLMNEVIPPSGVYPRGQALPLRAVVTVGPDDQRVQAHYRVRTDEGWETWQDIVLTHQESGVHERLVDTAAESLEVAFSTIDHRTETVEIPLVAPPAVVRATVHVDPPPYAAARFPPITEELGPGTDARSVVDEPSLIGSSVRLDLALNKPLAVPSEGRDEWLAETFGLGVDSDLAMVGEDTTDDHWVVTWTLESSRRLSLALVDEHGLENAEPIIYRIGAVEDHEPAVTVIEPQADLVVLPTAVIPLTSEAQDDVLVGTVGLEARLLRDGDVVEEAGWSIEEPAGTPTATIDHELALAAFELREGDELLVQGTATDTFENDGERHQVSRSTIRRLRVISEREFATQARRQLSAIRQNAIRIESLQSELQDDVIDHGPQPGADRAQAQIAERIADQREAMEIIESQIETNRFEDEQLVDLLQQSQDLLDFAGRAASQAIEAMDGRRGTDGSADAPQDAEPDQDGLREPKPEDEGIVEAQQSVRDELTDLIELLDRDEDTWVVTRQLESLLDRLERLQNETEQLNRRTVGRDVSDLDDDTRSDLERLADASREIGDESRQLTDDLPRRAEAMQDADPDAASGMRAAAGAAEQRELDRDLQQSEENISENRLANAMNAQGAAQETMERMLEEIERAHRAHTQQLLRRLASLIESIDRLIAVQENELLALSAAVANVDFNGRDRAMIRLAQNTQAVASEARAAGQEARRIARALDRAADAQGAAVVALRAVPIDPEAAEAAETRALEQLKEAKELAEAMEEAAQDEEVRRQREELIAAYRAFAEQQAGVRAGATELSAVDELSRRQLVEARRLATSQDEIATGLEDLRRTNSELADARVFSLVHGNIERWSEAASSGLREGKVDADVTDRQRRILRAIGRLIESLEEASAPPDEFAGDDGGEAAGGGSEGAAPPLIPPASELRLMHGVQEGIYDETRTMDVRRDLSQAQRRERLRELGEQQRD